MTVIEDEQDYALVEKLPCEKLGILGLLAVSVPDKV